MTINHLMESKPVFRELFEATRQRSALLRQPTGMDINRPLTSESLYSPCPDGFSTEQILTWQLAEAARYYCTAYANILVTIPGEQPNQYGLVPLLFAYGYQQTLTLTHFLHQAMPDYRHPIAAILDPDFRLEDGVIRSNLGSNSSHPHTSQLQQVAVGMIQEPDSGLTKEYNHRKELTQFYISATDTVPHSLVFLTGLDPEIDEAAVISVRKSRNLPDWITSPQVARTFADWLAQLNTNATEREQRLSLRVPQGTDMEEQHAKLMEQVSLIDLMDQADAITSYSFEHMLALRQAYMTGDLPDLTPAGQPVIWP